MLVWTVLLTVLNKGRIKSVVMVVDREPTLLSGINKQTNHL